MMKVFVWIDHGRIELHSAEDLEYLKSLAETIYKTIHIYSYDEQKVLLEIVYKKLCKSSSLENCRKFIKDMILIAGEDNESFEHGTGFCELKGA